MGKEKGSVIESLVQNLVSSTAVQREAVQQLVSIAAFGKLMQISKTSERRAYDCIAMNSTAHGITTYLDCSRR